MIAFTVQSYVHEEMDARGWDMDALVAASGETEPVRVCALELLVAAREDQAGSIKLDENTAASLGKAFGTSPNLWMNLDKAWWAGKERP